MDSRLRIGLVLGRFDARIGGLENWTDAMARWLVGRGHEVSIIASSGQCSDAGMTLHLVEPNPSPAAFAASLAARISQLDLDIVHDVGFGYRADIFQPHSGSRAINSEVDVAALPPMRRLRARLSPRLRRWRGEIAALERRQFADPDRLIAISHIARDQIASRYGLDPARIVVIYNGVDTGRFAPQRLAPLRNPARARWRLQGGPVFLVAANNFHLKGVATAVRALARLGTALPGACLLVAGNDDPARCSALAAGLGVAERVSFLGHVARMEEAYAAADAVIQPTYYDPCSLVTLEALACGLPVATTSSNGSAELMTHGNEGFVLPRADDAAALAAAMERMLDAELRRRMGAAGRKLALAHDLTANHAGIEDFYRRRLSAMGRTAAFATGD